MIGQRISERVSIPNIDSDDLLLIADRSDAYIIKKMTTEDFKTFLQPTEFLIANFPNVANNAVVTLLATSIIAVYEQKVVASVALWLRVNYEITRPLDGSLLHSIKKTTTAGAQNVRVEYY
jgi:hypothetical protein